MAGTTTSRRHSGTGSPTRRRPQRSSGSTAKWWSSSRHPRQRRYRHHHVGATQDGAIRRRSLEQAVITSPTATVRNADALVTPRRRGHAARREADAARAAGPVGRRGGGIQVVGFGVTGWLGESSLLDARGEHSGVTAVAAPVFGCMCRIAHARSLPFTFQAAVVFTQLSSVEGPALSPQFRLAGPRERSLTPTSSLPEWRGRRVMCLERPVADPWVGGGDAVEQLRAFGSSARSPPPEMWVSSIPANLLMPGLRHRSGCGLDSCPLAGPTR